jgi:hypothetical protein
MTEQLPDPFVPPDVDLNGYEFMPLYGDRLFGSDFSLEVSDHVFRVGLRMWWAAWKQVPAASLPGSEASLCKLAGFDSLAKWRKVRDQVMRNFVLCSDGRYYHRMLAPLAIKAWQARVEAQAKGKKGAAKRWSGHHTNVPEPVDKDGQAKGSGSPGHQKTVPQLQQSNASAIQNDSKREEILSRNSVQGRDSAAPARVTHSHERRNTPCPRFPSDSPKQANLRAEGWRLGLEPGHHESWDDFAARIRITRAA